MNSLILSTAARLVVWLMAAFSIYLLLRGHNQPGGGFVGGLVAAIAVALLAMANGARAARRAIRFDPRAVVVAGLAIALASGIVAALGEAAFLSGLWLFIADLPLGTPLLFDVGVYLAVFGAVATLILALEDEAS